MTVIAITVVLLTVIYSPDSRYFITMTIGTMIIQCIHDLFLGFPKLPLVFAIVCFDGLAIIGHFAVFGRFGIFRPVHASRRGGRGRSTPAVARDRDIELHQACGRRLARGIDSSSRREFQDMLVDVLWLKDSGDYPFGKGGSPN